MANEEMFPKGLRVLLVDDNVTCLKIFEKLLESCEYTVTITNEAVVGLQMLRENCDSFDIVISDVHMPVMDGFALLEHIGLELDIPVVMLSANDDPKAVMRGVKHGAVDYIVKPARILELKNIWQHVVRRNMQRKLKGKGVRALKDATTDVEANPDEILKNKRKDQKKNKELLGEAEGGKDKKEEQQGEESENLDSNSNKKARVIWSATLHKKFLAAVSSLGVEKAFPKKVLECMNVEGLTRENVASHLQKYRLYLKRANAEQSIPFRGRSPSTYQYRGSLSYPSTYQYRGSLPNPSTYQYRGSLSNPSTYQYRGSLSNPSSYQYRGSPSTYQNGGTLSNPFRSHGSLSSGGRVGVSATNLVGMPGAFPPSAHYNSNLSEPSSNIGNCMLTSKSMSNSRLVEMLPPQQNQNQNNNNNNNGNHQSHGALVVSPQVDYARGTENWQTSSSIPKPIVQQNLLVANNQPSPANFDNSFAGHGFTQAQGSLDPSSFTNASGSMSAPNPILTLGGQGQVILQDVSYNMVESQTWQQNMNGGGSTNICGGFAYNNNPMVPAIGSSNLGFEDFSSAEFNNNVGPIIEQPSDNSGLVQNMEASYANEVVADDNFVFEGSDLLAELTKNDSGTLDDIVLGGYPK